MKNIICFLEKLRDDNFNPNNFIFIIIQRLTLKMLIFPGKIINTFHPQSYLFAIPYMIWSLK